jgi:hypothetical protein
MNLILPLVVGAERDKGKQPWETMVYAKSVGGVNQRLLAVLATAPAQSLRMENSP